MKWLVILAVSSTLELYTNGQLTRDQMTSLSLKARKLPNDICGESTINEYTTISDSSAKLGAYPWMVAIGYMKYNKGPSWNCAGSLVTDQFVLTMAHCLHPSTLEELELTVKWVRVGDLDLNDTMDDGASPVNIEVESVKYHPEYDNTKKINDIGLIKLKTKIQFDALKKPICLPSPEFFHNSFVDFTSVVIGWGRRTTNMESKSRGSISLNEASVDIKDIDSCRRNITRSNNKLIVDERVVCALSPGKDACEGDSGGPLMMLRRYKSKTKMFLLGMVSYGSKVCALDGYPDIWGPVTILHLNHSEGNMEWLVILAVTSTLVLSTNSQLTRDQMTSLSLKARKLPNDICGESTINEYTTISESSAKLGAYPWMVAIRYTTRSKGPLWACAGSLVTDQFVLTVAHCVQPSNLRTLGLTLKWVRVGDLDLNDTVDDGASPVDIEVESTKFHPEYHHFKKINDVGLIKLKTKIQFDALKKPICLPSPEFYQNSFVDFTSVVIGYGRTINGVRTYLSEASVEIKDIDICRRNLTTRYQTPIVDERVVCASSPGKDACEGDSGGPLMMFRRYKGKTKIFLLGMVSYGPKICAVADQPGVYTRVSHFMDWIIDNLEL